MIGLSPERGCARGALPCMVILFLGRCSCGGASPGSRNGRAICSMTEGRCPLSATDFGPGAPTVTSAATARWFARTALHQQMATLATRIADNLQDPGDNWAFRRDTPTSCSSLPMTWSTASSPSMFMTPTSFPVRATDARNHPSETLYGNGPDECPQAYEYTSHQQIRGLIPRIPAAGGEACEWALTKGQSLLPLSRHRAKYLAERRQPARRRAQLLTEAMLADPRNDAHALVSQLTVLFQLLHNHVISLLEA